MSENNESSNKPLENSIPESLIKAQAYKEKYTAKDEEASEEPQKVIQIIATPEGVPVVQYNGSVLTPAEVIGLLDMSKEIIMTKSIGNSMLQQNIYNMLQGLT